MDKDQFLMELYEEAYEIGISDEKMGKLKEIANEDDNLIEQWLRKF